MELGEGIGRALATRHEQPVDADPTNSVVNYAERPRARDWTMRSALVRLAQPEPAKVAEVLELSRRLDVVLGHVSRALELNHVTCDRRLDLACVEAAARHEAGSLVVDLGEPIEPYTDARVVDLARACRAVPEFAPGVVVGYTALQPLAAEESAALPLVGVALRLDELAERLVEWSIDAPGPTPSTEVDQACGEVRSSLDELGVPVEEARRPAGRARG